MRTHALSAALLTVLLLMACGCTADAASTPTRTPVKDAGTPKAKATVSLDRVKSCAQARTVLDGIKTPLDLLKQGGTPVSWADDLRTAGTRFGSLGAITPAPVGTFESGLASDLSRLTTALDAGQTSTVHAVADVLTNRISSLTYQCHW